MSFYVFIFIAQCKPTFLHISTCAWGLEHKSAIRFFTTVHSNTVFHSVNESVFEWVEWPSNLTVPVVSLVSFYWISCFEWFVWYEWFSKSFIKTGTCCHHLVVYCHICSSMMDLNQPRFQHKNTFSKILFNYQYWPKFLYFRPQKEKENLQKIVNLIRIIIH